VATVLPSAPKAGTVHLVGAGPGAVDLLTLRAIRILGQADVVFHDALVSREILDLAPQAEKIAVGKRSGRFSTAQRFINKQLADAARKHRVVVRLKGGDPMLFGRAHEEIDFLRKSSIQVEVVPGITAATAASAEIGISLTRRGAARSVALVTPRVGQGEMPSNWIAAALAADTVAIYMAVGEADAIAASLIAAGKPRATPVALVENASLPERRAIYGRLHELGALAAELSSGPALILLGEVFSEAAAAARPAQRRRAQTR